MTDRRWAVLHWPRGQAVSLKGFVQARHQPAAMLQAMDRWPAAKTDDRYFVRPAWRGAAMHYTELTGGKG